MQRDKLRKRLKDLFGLMGSPNEHESNNAKAKIVELLAKHQMSWNAGLELIGATAQARRVPAPMTRMIRSKLLHRGAMSPFWIASTRC